MDLQKTVTTAELAPALGLTQRSVQIRAVKEEWPADASCKKYKFHLNELPIQIQSAHLQFLSTSSGVRTGNEVNAEFDLLNDKQKLEARRRLALILDFEAYAIPYGSNKRTKAMKDFCRIKNLSVTSLKRWEKDNREGGLSGLAPGYGKTRNFASWPDEAKAFLKQLYLNENQPTARWCIAQTRLEAAKRTWDLPSDETMQRFLCRIPQDVKDFYRKGEKYWRQKHIPSVLRDYNSIQPGEIFVADHRQLDIVCRFPDGRVGRPWLTGILDMRSRKLVGCHLDSIPSTATILLAMKYAFERYGLPPYFLMDNGRDFSGRLLSGGYKRFRLHVEDEEILGVLLLLAIKALFALPANARAKIIEIWFKCLHDFERQWPTYLGFNTMVRPPCVDERIKKGAQVPELQQVWEGLKNFIQDKNQNHAHSGHGMNGRTPNEVWDEHFKTNAIRRASPESLRLLLMKGKIHKISRYGVETLNSVYRSDDLAGLVGQSITYRFDPNDLQKIFVYKPDGAFLCVADKWVRTAWDDESELIRLKHFEKQRRRAIKSEMEAARELIKIESGYRPAAVDEVGPNKAKVVSIVRTPIDGIAAKISKGDEAEEPRPSIVRDALRKKYGDAQ